MRALLLYNPSATTTTSSVTDEIVAMLAADLELEVAPTKRRGHATFLAAGAVHEGYDVVLTLGGDGTMNEAMQPLVGTDVVLGAIPGGSTNVWARTLGLPNDPRAATRQLLDALAARRFRRVNLGLVNGRWFGFNAGFGFDAEVVRIVERRHRLKRTVRQATFIYSGLLALLGGFRRRVGAITLRIDGEPVATDLRSAVCCNSDPYAYLGRLPARICPAASLDAGIDVAGLARLSVPSLLALLVTAITSDHAPRRRHLRVWHDLPTAELTTEAPLPLQVDGDYVGETTRVRLGSVARALCVVA